MGEFDSSAEARAYGLTDGYHDGVQGSGPSVDLDGDAGDDYTDAYRRGYRRGQADASGKD